MQTSVEDYTLTLQGNGIGTAAVEVTAIVEAGSSAFKGEQTFFVVVDPPTAPPNAAPLLLETPNEKVIPSGAEVSFDASRYFRDPDGDGLTYTATAEPSRGVEISISGSDVILEGRSRAGALIALLATDSRGLATRVEFEVTVTRGVLGG